MSLVIETYKHRASRWNAGELENNSVSKWATLFIILPTIPQPRMKLVRPMVGKANSPSYRDSGLDHQAPSCIPETWGMQKRGFPLPQKVKLANVKLSHFA